MNLILKGKGFEEQWDRLISEDDANCNEEDYERNLLSPMD